MQQLYATNICFGRMALKVVGLMERRGQANMPPHSLLPRPQGVGKKNQSAYFIAVPRKEILQTRNSGKK
jgi:hypothetical protein